MAELSDPTASQLLPVMVILYELDVAVGWLISDPMSVAQEWIVQRDNSHWKRSDQLLFTILDELYNRKEPNDESDGPSAAP